MAWWKRSLVNRLGTPFVACLTLVFLHGPLFGGDTSPSKDADFLVKVLKKSAPSTISELKAIQAQVTKVIAKVQPATVGIVSGGASGSGVIISKDGYVLTAGHVSGEKDRSVRIIFPDGTQKRGKTLGLNRDIDSGLIKITDEGEYPFVEMGKSSDLHAGQWVISMGHPGGYRQGRSPVVRLGRVQTANNSLISTDCTLVGGDSGGPLYDMDGKVVGIHSRIGVLITANIHVPVDTYRETWDRLAKSEVWGNRIGGGRRGGNRQGYLGVRGPSDSEEAVISEVLPNSPAEKAGIKVGDIVTKFDNQPIDQFADLVEQVARKRSGQEVSIEVQRGQERITLKVRLALRPSE